MSIIRVGAVSYLNTKPLLWGVERSPVRKEMALQTMYPAKLAEGLRAGALDMALLPVAAMADITGAQIVSRYGIGADGPVASVGMYGTAPLEEWSTVYLDYQSRTSVQLAKLLIKHFWKRKIELLPAPHDYIERIEGPVGGVIIGDRALAQGQRFPYRYDLAGAWRNWTGLPFVFAAWVATRPLPAPFMADFDAAQRRGLGAIPDVVAENPFPPYDLTTYYTENIRYELDERMHSGLQLFLQKLREEEAATEG